MNVCKNIGGRQSFKYAMQLRRHSKLKCTFPKPPEEIHKYTEVDSRFFVLFVVNHINIRKDFIDT